MKEGRNHMKHLSRRDFMKSTAAGALSLGLMSLTGCASAGESTAAETSANAATSTTAAPENLAPAADGIAWDKEVEVIVVGTGTVCNAAVAASEFGATSVLVLEKSEFMFGGTSVTSGAGFALPPTVDDIRRTDIEYTREDALAYLKQCGEGRMDEEPMIAYLDTANEYCQWAKKTFGWHHFGRKSKGFGDYYDMYSKSIPGGYGTGACYPMNEEGKAYSPSEHWDFYRNYIDNHDNIELLMGTAADELITDESGRVIGLYAIQGDKKLAFKATRGVILGTGSFDFNESMRKYFLPFPLVRSVASSQCTGDGHRMASQIGAQMAYMDRVYGMPMVYDKTTWTEEDNHNYSIFASASPRDMDIAYYITMPHSIMVNRKGKRFSNENRLYDCYYRAFSSYDTGSGLYENIPAYWVCDSSYAEKYKMPGNSTIDALPEYVFKFDTLEELADSMGIDKENLLAEVARYNGYVAAGYDPDYHTGESEVAMNTYHQVSTWMKLDYDGSDVQTPTDLLGDIVKPPFYSCRFVPGSISTRGGIRTNGSSQALNVKGEIIPGLYATGCCSAGISGYIAGGMPIATGCIMSYIAGKHIMA